MPLPAKGSHVQNELDCRRGNSLRARCLLKEFGRLAIQLLDAFVNSVGGGDQFPFMHDIRRLFPESCGQLIQYRQGRQKRIESFPEGVAQSAWLEGPGP